MTENEIKALEICKEEVKKADLPMKMVDASYNSKDRKIIFRFVAPQRVDFRELVKTLKSRLHVKVELHQTGPRDEAMEIGGLPPCGKKEICCKQFGCYPRVTDEMLKAQRIKPSQKMYGYCGRLKCCLSYEFFNDGDTTESKDKPLGDTEQSQSRERSDMENGAKPKRYMYLIRHPQTTVKDQSIYIDGETDVKLSLKGKQQIKKLLKALHNHKLSKIFTSPLKRAKDAAIVLSKKLQLPIEEIEDIREINVGIWRGMHEKDIRKQYKKLWDAWLNRPDITKLPEGESISQVQSRVLRAIKYCEDNSEGNIAIVCHKVVILTYLASIEGIPLRKIWEYDKKHPIKMGQILKIDLTNKKVLSFNER